MTNKTTKEYMIILVYLTGSICCDHPDADSSERVVERCQFEAGTRCPVEVERDGTVPRP